jgi:mono/diheme cytochrome c family protein
MGGSVSTTPDRSAFGDPDVLGRVFAVMVLALVAAAPARAQSSSGSEGEAIYRVRCAGCHEGGAVRAPDLATLGQMPQDRVLTALRSGSMSSQGQGLTAAQLENLSRFVAGDALARETALSNGACPQSQHVVGLRELGSVRYLMPAAFAFANTPTMASWASCWICFRCA